MPRYKNNALKCRHARHTKAPHYNRKIRICNTSPKWPLDRIRLSSIMLWILFFKQSAGKHAHLGLLGQEENSLLIFGPRFAQTHPIKSKEENHACAHHLHRPPPRPFPVPLARVRPTAHLCWRGVPSEPVIPSVPKCDPNASGSHGQKSHTGFIGQPFALYASSVHSGETGRHH